MRLKGQHYRDMYILAAGCADVDMAGDGSDGTVEASNPGTPIGEIGFLRGWPATATVTARTATSVYVIDDGVLAGLEKFHPALAAELLRYCADVASERTSNNLTWEAKRPTRQSSPIEVFLCRNEELMERAKRLRYEVYCEELGRQSPFADHEKKTISDEFDKTAQVFVAVENGEVIGTLRGNAAAEASLGALEDLYGMKSSPHHPQATSICTKFMVKKKKRGGPAAMKLITAMVSFGLRYQIKECFIDCIPALLPYYQAVGFVVSGEEFLHRENGHSIPMRLDLMKYGARLSKEAGLREYVTIIATANAIKLFNSAKGYTTSFFQR